MKLPNAALLLALSTMAVAAPEPQSEVNVANATELGEQTNKQLGQRSPVFHQVTWYEHKNKRGKSATVQLRTKVCYNFSDTWNNRISSIYHGGPSMCFLFEDKNCRGRSDGSGAPGTNDFRGGDAGLNDKFSSIKCSYW